jgi:hypothetical protein
MTLGTEHPVVNLVELKTKNRAEFVRELISSFYLSSAIPLKKHISVGSRSQVITKEVLVSGLEVSWFLYLYVSAFLMNPCFVTIGFIPFFLTIDVPVGLEMPLLEGVLLMLDSLDLVFLVTIGPVAIFFFIGASIKILQK